MRDSRKEFGAWLAGLRGAAEIESQEDAARAMHREFGSKVTSAQISDYERGVNTPDGRRFWELLSIYGVSYEQQPRVPLPPAQERLVAIEEALSGLRADVAELAARVDLRPIEIAEAVVAAVTASLERSREIRK